MRGKKIENTVNARFTQGLLVKKQLNEHIMYWNFSFLIEKSSLDLPSLLHNLIYRF